MLLSTQIGLNINKDKTRPIHVIYMYQTSNTVKIDKIGHPTKATRTKPLETKRKVLIGIRMGYDVWVAMMLISLANDSETHLGPSIWIAYHRRKVWFHMAEYAQEDHL